MAGLSIGDIMAYIRGRQEDEGPTTHPTAWTDAISYPLRYGVSPEEYARKEAEIRQAGLPSQLQALAASRTAGGGQGEENPNIIDRYMGQRIAAENSFWPEAVIKGANTFAFGDPFLDAGEAERTKAAGELGRNMGYGQEPETQMAGLSLADILGGE